MSFADNHNNAPGKGDEAVYRQELLVPGARPCVADIVTDGVVNGADLALVLTNWGPCASSTCVADIDRDGTVGASDLSIVLASWGGCAN